MRRYPAYKNSGVKWLGEVPEGWAVRRFKEFLKERDERSIDGSETLLSVSAYTGVPSRSDHIEEGAFLTRAESLEGYKVCSKNDLVMNIMLAWNRAQGITGHDGIVSPAYAVFSCDRTVNSAYLNYLVPSDDYCLYFKVYSAGVIDSRLRLYPDTFGRLHRILPPLAEQQAIAAFLNRETAKIDALVEEQRRLIALLAEKRQAVISHAVTRGLNPDAPLKPSGIDWLGDIPDGWEVRPLKSVATVQTGIAKGKAVDPLKRLEIPYVHVANVQDGYLDLAEVATIGIEADQVDRYLLRPGDVLMNEGGDFDKLGRGAIWGGEVSPCIHQNHVFAVRPADISSDWLSTIIGSDYAKFYFMTRSKQSTNLASISSTNLMNLPVLIPGSDEQQGIIAFLRKEGDAFDALTATATTAIALLQERRAALISAAVTGKIDVRDLSSQTLSECLEPA
ncbi:restriction endonuclease subunit S [Cereibacter johrii]|uniref:restriction endonuclease subunit S n=1 Tax=Cereibacter johrii TaxID=445629 RepID=UPI000DCD352D|nr:restriction endonuclease subunit S [Cereibacter johrii]RAZ83823.1 type I restriction endonuclease subunit S [Cereibacter johrii]